MKKYLKLIVIATVYICCTLEIKVQGQECPQNYMQSIDTVGDFNGTTYPDPPFYYSHQSSIQGGSWAIFQREHLAQNGIYGDTYIRSITLCGKSGGKELHNVRIYMSEVSLREFHNVSDSIDLANMTLVATIDTISLPLQKSDVTIVLSNEFHYTGQGHLAIAFMRGNDASFNYKYPVFVCEKAGTSIVFRQSSALYDKEALLTSYVPAIIFNTCQTLTPLLPPTQVTTTVSESSGIHVSWSGTSGSYELALGRDGSDPDTSTSLYYCTSNSIDINNLTGNRHYEVYVRASNAGTYSAWAKADCVWLHNCEEGGNLTISDTIDYYSMGAYPPFFTNNSSSEAVSWSLYTREELEDMGVYAGSTIYSIGYSVYGNYYTSAITETKIYMKEVAITQLNSASDSLSLDSMTSVHTSGWHIFNQGWTYLDFDTPFTYSGTGSLMVAVRRGERISYNYNVAFYCKEKSSIYRFDANSGRDSWTPTIALCACSPDPTCVRPYSLEHSVADSAVTLMWNTSADTFEVVVVPHDHDVSNESNRLIDTLVVGNSCNITSLPSGRHYDFAVRGICANTPTRLSNAHLFGTPGTLDEYICSDGLADTVCQILEWDNGTCLWMGTSTENDLYYNSQCWTIYGNEELTAGDLYPGSIIKGISFYNLDVSESSSLHDVTVYIGETQLDTNEVIYNHSNQTTVARIDSMTLGYGWVDIDFEVPFHYTGNHNLAVGFFVNGYTRHGAYFKSNASGMTYCLLDGSGDMLRSIWSDSRPIVRFKVCDSLPECMRPRNIAFSVTDSSIRTVISGSADSYRIVAGTPGFNPDAITSNYPRQAITDSNVYVFYGLNPGTEYDIYVQSICGTGASPWSERATVHTSCGIQSTPYYNECNSASAIDSCIILHNAYFANSPTSGIYGENSSRRSFAVLPQFDDPLVNLHISFPPASGEHSYEIGVMTNPNDTSTFIPYDTIQSENPIETDMHRYGGPDGRLSIRWDGSRLGNISVDTVPVCYLPFNIGIAYDSAIGATVTWRNRSAFATGYSVICRPMGSADQTIQTVADNTITIGNITPRTLYEVLIATQCSNGSLSEWVPTHFFSHCSPITQLPYTIDEMQVSTIDTTPFFVAPCWTHLIDTTTNTSMWVLPEIDTSQIRMDHLKLAYNITLQCSNDALIEFGVMDNNSDMSGFVAFDTMELQSGASVVSSGEQATYCPLRQGRHLAMRATNATITGLTSATISEDRCHPVKNITLIGSTDTSLIVSWRSQSPATQWIVRHSASNGSDSGTFATSTESCIIEPLSPYTFYDIWISAVSQSDTSEPAHARFRTMLRPNETIITKQIGQNEGSDHYVPIPRENNHTWAQYLYPMHLYSTAGYIDTIWFYCSQVRNTPSDDSVSLYMSNVPDGYSPEQDSWLPFDSLQLVYHSTQWPDSHFVGWVPLVLDNPFFYDGSGRMSLTFLRDGNSGHNNDKFQYFYVDWRSFIEAYREEYPANAGYIYENYIPIMLVSMRVPSCLSIDSLSLDSIVGNSVSLSWIERGAATMWQVRYLSEDSSIEGTVIVDSIPRINLHNVPTNHLYTFKVRPICSESDTGLYFGNVTAEIITCPPPYGLHIDSIAENTATLSWNVNETDALWEIQYESLDSTHTGSVTSYSVPASVTGLHNYTKYTFRVRSVCGENDSSMWTQPIQATTLRGDYDHDIAQTGTIGGSSSFYTPFNAFYCHSWCQMIIPADSIGFEGYIDTLWWHAASVGAPLPDTSVTIYMGHRANSVHTADNDWLPASQLQQVFHANQAQPSNTGWFAIPLHTVFHYNGVDNLVICVSYHGSYWTQAWKYHNSTVPNSVLRRSYDYDESYGHHPGANNGHRGDDLPITRLSMSSFNPFETCHPPTELSAPNAYDASSTVLQWHDNADASLWQLSYGIDLPSPSDGEMVYCTSTHFQLPPLAIGQHYNAFVRTICGNGDTSRWAGPLRFVAGDIPMRHNRCDTIFTCHSRICNHERPRAVYNDTLVIYPSYEGSLIAIEHVSSHIGYTIEVFDGAGTDNIRWGVYRDLDSIPRLISTHGPLTLTFTTNIWYDNDILIDIVCVDDNGCHATQQVTAHHILDTTARLHWTRSDTSQHLFSIAWGPYESFDTSDASTYNVITNIHDTSAILTGLQPGSHYLAAVRAECGNSLHSRWTISNDFYTSCMAVRHVDLPFSEDFSSWGPVYHGDAPLDSLINPCWNFATTLNRAFIYHDWDENHYVIMQNDYGQMSALVLPLFEDSICDLTISFDIKNVVSAYAEDYVPFEVGVMDNPRDIATFCTVWRDSLIDDILHHYTVPLNPYSGNGRYLAIAAAPPHDHHRYLRLYNVAVTMDLPCMPPVSLGIDSIGLYEATVSVDDTTQPDLRQFIISLVDDTHQAFDSIATTGTSCTFTHLDQGSRYYVWVRNIQTIDRNPVWSPWAGPVTFMTLKIPEPVYYTARAYSNNPAIGSADVLLPDGQSGSTCTGSFPEGTILLFSATPIGSKSLFLYWNDGDTSNPRTVTLTQDTILTAYFETVGINEAPTAQPAVTVIPNPASDMLTVKSKSSIVSIECYDMRGSRLFEISGCDAAERKIDVSNLTSGTYILITKTVEGQFTTKIIIKR